jgi:glutamine synthetase
VLCEVMMPDGVTPHPSNKRATILDDEGAWFGFEQEYFFYKDGRPLGFPPTGYPAPQLDFGRFRRRERVHFPCAARYGTEFLYCLGSAGT